MKVDSIFFVESPLQFSNAVTLIKFKKLVPIIVVRLNGEIDNDSQLSELTLNFSGTRKFINIKKSNKFTLFYSTIKLMLFFTSLKWRGCSCFLGDWRSIWMKAVAYSINPNKVNVIDDGFATLTVINQLENKIARNNTKGYLLNCKRFRPTFYTYFPVESDVLNVINLSAKNNNSSIVKEVVNTIMFIGAPLVEKQIIKCEDYLLYITKALSKYPENQYKNIEYVPHRAEHSDNYNRVAALDNRVSIKKLDQPIEDYINKNKEVPAVFLSFYSTALYNLSEYAEKSTAVAIYLPFDIISNKYRTQIENVYQFFESKSKVSVLK